MSLPLSPTSKIATSHLDQLAIAYVRQSSQKQVRATSGWVHGRQTNVEKLWVIWADRDEVKRLRKRRVATSRGILGYPLELTEPKRRP